MPAHPYVKQLMLLPAHSLQRVRRMSVENQQLLNQAPVLQHQRLCGHAIHPRHGPKPGDDLALEQADVHRLLQCQSFPQIGLQPRSKPSTPAGALPLAPAGVARHVWLSWCKTSIPHVNADP